MNSNAKAIQSKQKSSIDRELPGIFDKVTDIVGHTPMVRINRLFSEFPEATVLGKLEFLNPSGSMKDRIALKMIEIAEEEGRIKPGDTLVEPTSGNTGLALVMAAAVKGYKIIITMPVKMSEEKRRLLKAYGAELILTPTEYGWDHPEGYIEVAKRLAEENDHIHLLNQYSNPGNPIAHFEGTGQEIWEQTEGNMDYFVSGMGTGGTISGTAKYLKEKNPSIQIIGADPEGSIYTGGEPHPYFVEGIGYDFFPEVFDRDIVDRMFRISDEESFSEARRAAPEEGILVGGSTGTVIAATRKIMKELQEKNELKDKVFVIMIHDSGKNYLSTFYNDDWMKERDFKL
jgi:cystathionine beta-synthase